MSDSSPKPGNSIHVPRLAGQIAHLFIQSKLTPLVIVGALLLGTFTILRTPREEEPQIVVPMLDVFVQMPGASAEEVTQRATVPMEKLIREIPGVEYIYSISHPGLSMVIVRFYVGTKEEDAIVKTYNKLYSNFDRIPQGVSQPIIKARSIDDVPILALTLWGKNYDGGGGSGLTLRRALENSRNLATVHLLNAADHESHALLEGQPESRHSRIGHRDPPTPLLFQKNRDDAPTAADNIGDSSSAESNGSRAIQVGSRDDSGNRGSRFHHVRSNGGNRRRIYTTQKLR